MEHYQIAFHTYGALNEAKSNVVWVCHALTANSDVFDWWKGLFGADDLFNPDEHFIVCANVIGSCYGSTGPLSLKSDERPYFHTFPAITVKDMVTFHRVLADHLHIKKIQVLIGGSLGGQQALEWSIRDHNTIESLIIIATNASHSPWGIAFNESQRMAIAADQTWLQETLDAGSEGLKVARAIALLSYRTYVAYQKTQSESHHDKRDDFRSSSYQQYQGLKLSLRFNAFSYWVLTKAMDSHNVGRGHESISQALSSIQAKTLVIGINSDFLFPTHEQAYLCKHIKNAVFKKIDSDFGHDGFLIETKAISELIKDFWHSEKKLKPYEQIS